MGPRAKPPPGRGSMIEYGPVQPTCTLELVISAPPLTFSAHVHTHEDVSSPEGRERTRIGRQLSKATAKFVPWVEMKK